MPFEQLGQQPDNAVNLESSSLDNLVAALVSGQPIFIPQINSYFILNNEDARKAFYFYASRKDLWQQQRPVTGREVEELLEAFNSPLAITNCTSEVSTSAARPRWKLTQIRAHRFAGLHRHCDDDGQAPEQFVLDIDRDVTCIWGFNGAGKTALQSAVMWCLTGQALRSQHKPSEIHEPIAVDILSVTNDDEGALDQQEISLNLPPIVPMPSSKNLAALQDRPCIDTWVELSLRDQSGHEVIVKREFVRGPKGAVSVQSSGLERLGLSQLAIEAGSLMPAIAAAMRFDEKTTFAHAISLLTGLRPLQELGVRSERIRRRLSKEEVEKAHKAKESALTQFQTCKGTFVATWSREFETLGKPPVLLAPDHAVGAASCEETLQLIKDDLERLCTQGQQSMSEILGADFSAINSKEEAATLEELLLQARDLFSSASLAHLSGIQAIKPLKHVRSEDYESIIGKLEELRTRAIEQVARQQKKTEAARWRLYTLVSQWHRIHHPGELLSDCPVCGSDLSKVPPDALLDKGVLEALRHSAEAHTDASRTLADWQKEASSELLESIPEALKSLIDKKPVESLVEIYRKAYVYDLFNNSLFDQRLRQLKKNAEQVWNLALKEFPLPDFPEKILIELPKELQGTNLDKRFNNLQILINLAKQRALCEEQLRSITQRYFGSASINFTKVLEQYTELTEAPLRTQVEVLRQSIVAAEPLLSLLKQLTTLKAIQSSWKTAEVRLELLKKVAEAVAQFLDFPKLVFGQVEALLETLDSRTVDWLNIIYRPHYPGGPSYRGLDPSRSHGLGLYAGIDNARVHAHQVMNSSHLRACVWAFIFSLWERIRDTSGAIDLLLLDDPQTLFDPINTENLAAAVPALVKAGMLPIITSNDVRFIAAVKSKLPRQSSQAPTWTMLQISPISSSRLTAALTPSVEEVYERREVWRGDSSDHNKAQQFVERVRLHIENRLGDLLAADPMLIYKPTLADLMGHLSRARNSGECPFNEEPFERLLASKPLRWGSTFYTIINQAHHDLRNINPFDATEVDKAFDEIDRLLCSCNAAYARFMGRLTRDDESFFFATPAVPDSIIIDRAPIRLLGDFSARTSSDVLALELCDQFFSLSEIGDIAFYAVRSSSLGALALPGHIVAVSLTAQPKNGDPVIALRGNSVFARRYHVDKSDLSKITLAGDLSCTEKVAPALILQRNTLCVLPIAGIFYTDLARSGPGAGEAYSIDHCSIIDKPLVAAHVVEDSGYPVMKSGDIVLLEEVTPRDSAAWDALKGTMVAFTASNCGEQFAYLKRVGCSIFGSMRLFENIGTFGDALAVMCTGEYEESDRNCLKIQKVWRVHGVIRKGFY